MAGFGPWLNAIGAGLGMVVNDLMQQRQKEQQMQLQQQAMQRQLMMLNNYLQEQKSKDVLGSALGGGLSDPFGGLYKGAGGSTSSAMGGASLPGMTVPSTPSGPISGMGRFGGMSLPSGGMAGALGLSGVSGPLAGQPAPPANLLSWAQADQPLSLPPPRTNAQDAAIADTLTDPRTGQKLYPPGSTQQLARAPDNTPVSNNFPYGDRSPDNPLGAQPGGVSVDPLSSMAEPAAKTGFLQRVPGSERPFGPGEAEATMRDLSQGRVPGQQAPQQRGQQFAQLQAPDPDAYMQRMEAFKQQLIARGARPADADAYARQRMKEAWDRDYRRFEMDRQIEGDAARRRGEDRAIAAQERTNAIAGQMPPQYGSFVGADGKKQQGEVYWDKQQRAHINADTGEKVTKFAPLAKPEAETPEIEIPESWKGMPSKPPPGIQDKVWTWAIASVKSGGEIKPPLPWGKSALRDQFNAAIPAAQYALGIDPQDMDKQKIEYTGRLARERSIQNAFGSGILGRNVVSINTVADHLSLLRQYADALRNHEPQIANQIINRMATQAGWPETIQFALAGTIAGDEVVRLLTTTGGTREDREGIQRMLSPYSSPEQLMGGIDTLANFVRSRYDPLKQQYARGDPERERYFIDNMLTPEAQDLYKSGPPATVRTHPAPSSEGAAAPQQSVPQGGPQEGDIATAPGKPTLIFRGGAWVPQ